MFPLFGQPNRAPHHLFCFCSCFWPLTNGVTTRLLCTRTLTVLSIITRSPSHPLSAFLSRLSTLPSRHSPTRPNRPPPTCRLVSPSLRLLLHSTLQRTSPTPPSVLSSCLPARSLPKKGPPLREIAIALVASILGGFETVTMFCTLGVYVIEKRSTGQYRRRPVGLESRTPRNI